MTVPPNKRGMPAKQYLYIAISGDRVDGHLFLKEVFDKGAGAALVSESFNQIKGYQILVNNTISAIGKVSTLWREQFDLEFTIFIPITRSAFVM